jgi:hypothetical protein
MIVDEDFAKINCFTSRRATPASAGTPGSSIGLIHLHIRFRSAFSPSRVSEIL